MDYKNIEKLLEKYWACETTAEEEERLRLFYAEKRKDLPESLARYESLFTFQAEERKKGLNEIFDWKITQRIKEKQEKSKRRLKLGMRWAALLLLFIGMGQVIRHMERVQHTPSADTFQNPQEALAQVEKTLMLVSDKLNQVQQKAGQNLERTEILVKYIK